MQQRREDISAAALQGLGADQDLVDVGTVAGADGGSLPALGREVTEVLLVVVVFVFIGWALNGSSS